MYYKRKWYIIKKIYLKARAKINLNLEIIDKRQDGYHNIESIFQKINIYDEIYLEKIDNNDIMIDSNVNELNNKDNIIYKAYVKLKQQYNRIGGVKVYLKKNIPMQAGMGGGSTDCASFILGMNKLYNLNLSNQEMINIGVLLGADVVSCYYNTAVKVEGIGEKIKKINTNYKYYIVILKPDFVCNTKEMYKKIDEMNQNLRKENTNKIAKALEENKIKDISGNLFNIFEEVVSEKEELYKMKKDLLQNGALSSLMTGSGSCVYGIFEDKKTAYDAYKNLKETYNAFICTSYNNLKRGDF